MLNTVRKYVPGYNFNPINLRMEKAISIHHCRTKLYLSAYNMQGEGSREVEIRVVPVEYPQSISTSTHHSHPNSHPSPNSNLNSPQQTHPTTPHTNSHLIPHPSHQLSPHTSPYSHHNKLTYSTMHCKHLTSCHNITCPANAINGRHRVESGRGVDL